MKRAFLWVAAAWPFWMGAWSGAEPMPDDHGNRPADATVMAGTSNTVTGSIEYDMDTDVFSFPFLPWRSYSICIETGTVWDVQVDLVPPDRNGVVWYTNTAWMSASLTADWTNAAAASRWHLAVYGLFRFTTGSYTLSVWETPHQDTDSDGIADRWELHYFENLDVANATSDYTGDGFSDRCAYLAGMSPMEALNVDLLMRSPDRDEVSWMSAPYGTYALYSAARLDDPWMWEANRASGPAGGRLVWTNQPGSSSQRFYRVEFQY